MGNTGQEREVKFLLVHPTVLVERLSAQRAQVLQPRTHEVNLRFDTPEGDLVRGERVLRLRKDTEARLTYKGPGRQQEGIHLRQELEINVSDFDTARLFLEALGYQIIWMYEKYRTTYRFGEAVVTLDEMPFGNFAEIEGPDGACILRAAESLHLEWERRILDSYMVLFERVKAALGLSFRDLSFENFRGLSISPAALGVLVADPSGELT